MQWSEIIKDYTQPIKPIFVEPKLIRKIFSLIDLTSLNESDTDADIAALCDKARSDFGHVAAICVYPKFLPNVAARFIGSAIKIATVANFPEANQELDIVVQDIQRSIQLGAQEVDVVFPYHRYLAGEQQYARSFVEACKTACGESIQLKVILETGALIDPVIIADAAYEAFAGGADFVKTSTGKISAGATLEAVAALLLVIKHVSPQLKRNLGLKISGGIRQIQQAAQYLLLAEQIMGKEWAAPDTLRFGTSKLVDEILLLA